MTAINYDGLYTLRCSASNNLTESETTTELFESDATGNSLVRPEIDAPDAPPTYAIRLDLEEQCMHLIDPLSSGILATTTSLSPNKLRLITLFNPTSRIELKNKSLISYEWRFIWGEDWKFVWHRSRDSLSTSSSGYTLSISRKPDPDVAVAVYRPTKKCNLVQLLDYNLSRFDIEDRKGLEIVILSSLFAILHGDKLDTFSKANVEQDPLRVPTTTSPSPKPGLKRRNSDEVETISPNEIVISTHLSEEAYIGHCLNLLSDPGMIYLSLVANSAETVPRAISIASEVKRRVIKSSPRDNENLMQYIDYPGRTRRESNKDKTPPGRIKIYLSRIQLEEFTPKVGPSSSSDSATEKERLAAHLRERDTPPRQRPHVPAGSSSRPTQHGGARLQRPPGGPPLPPKGRQTNNTPADSQAEQSRLRAFFSRARSDPV